MTKYENYVGNPFSNPAVLYLCPGIRGLERGLERAIGRIRTVAYVEIEAFIIENLVAEMEQGILAPAPIWTNVKTFDGRPFRNKIHGIIGGYPCQPFSNAGQRNGTEDPRHLYPFISGIIKTTRPVWCFFENVEGHLSLGYSEVSADLRTMGYAVEAGIYSAAETGATHERNRLFILAIKQDCLAYSNSNGNKEGYGRRGIECTQGGSEEKNREWERLRDKPTPSSQEKLGNASIEGLEKSRFGNVGKLSEKTGDGLYDRPEQPSNEELANTNGSGGGEDREQSKFWADGIEQSSCNSGTANEREDNKRRFDRWTARPGEQQYEWEEPRVKSRLGSTINGYNFREDFLRALGNSVVEQTAEIAWIDLFNKHMESWKKLQ